MRFDIRRFGVVLGFSLLAVFVAVGTVLFRNELKSLSKAQEAVTHSRGVQLELVQTESLLKDAETGQRGFLYTGNPQYLAPYNQAVAQIDSHLDAIANLVADNPAQQRSATELRTLAHEKLAELRQTISLQQAGKSGDARAVVLSARDLNLTTHIQDVTNKMEAAEERLELEQERAYEIRARRTTAILYLSAILRIGGLGLLAWLILHAMTTRERHARELREREEWLRVTLTSIGDGVIATDASGKVAFVNAVAATLTGWSDQQAMGQPIQAVFPVFDEITGLPTDDPVVTVLRTSEAVHLPNHIVLETRQGQRIPIEDSAAPILDGGQKLLGAVLTFRDVRTERKARELLRKTDKLSAAARLSATVAHEINNPLAAVANLVYLVKTMPDLPTEASEYLGVAENELERVAHITRQTLGFYRESKGPELLEVMPIVVSVLEIYWNKLKSKEIEIHRQFEDCPPVMGVSGEIRQAISNLLTNAMDAAGRKGAIWLTLRSAQLDDQKIVEFVVADSGTGIPNANRAHIFEPFFTTKENVGTGLGLWATREIIERHGGSITLLEPEASPGSGACFVLRLPAVPKSEAE